MTEHPLADDIKALMLKKQDGSKDATGLKPQYCHKLRRTDEIVHAVKKLLPREYLKPI